jgi:bifunctional UDP-N-acetylglucosamine pyrophosphorylase / glucosamine-1-phosphate N-acetyltransferase
MTDPSNSSPDVRPLEVCVLAAGMGTRMRSSVPKAMQPLCGKPLLGHLLDTIARLDPSRVHVVIGPEGVAAKQQFSEQFQEHSPQNINWVMQHERRGTGHAVAQAIGDVHENTRLLILVGDAPLISLATLQALTADAGDFSLLTVMVDDPTGYGRIIRDEAGQVRAIIEHRDTTSDQRMIPEINTGIMCVDSNRLVTWLPQLRDDNDQGELLLTDIVALAHADNVAVSAVVSPDPLEVTGVNSMNQLVALERALCTRLAEQLQSEGVYIADPARFDCRGTLTCGRDVRIDCNTIFEGHVVLGDGVSVGAGAVVRNSTIGDGCTIKAYCVIDECSIGANSQIGPFARLRPGTTLAQSVLIGNFVEVKNSHVGTGSKASHLSYLGDATLGEGVNVGAGTITCNYDGVAKHQTHIDDGAFIGSNTALVAPVKVGASATVAAGSTITRDVEAGSLALGRSRQRNVPNWKARK